MSKLPWSVRIVTALWGALLFGASLVWPIAQGYDEVAHVDMAYVYSQQPFEFYGPGELHYTASARGIQQRVPGTPTDHPLADRPVAPRGERPTLDGLGGHAPVTGGNPNQMIQHPPLAYWMDAIVLRVPGVSGLPWDAQVWALRLLGVALALPLPALCWATARRLLRHDACPEPWASRAALAAALVPVSMPNLARVCSSVSNDVVLIAAGSVLLYLLARVGTGDLRVRTGVGVGMALLVALLTKGPALVLVPVTGATYLLAGWGSRPSRLAGLRRMLPALAAAAVGGALGGLWWLRNLLVYGTLQPSGYGEAFMRAKWGVVGDANDGSVTSFPYGRFFAMLIDRIWGGIGLADRLTPGSAFVYGWFAVVALGLLAAILVRGGSAARLFSVVVVAAPVLTVLLLLPGSVGLWVRLEGAGPAAAQGRYVYHLVVGVAACSVAGWARMLRPQVWRHLPLLVLAAGLLTQALSWVVVLKNWYARDFQFGSGVAALLRWSPVPGPITTTAVLLPAVAGVVALVAVAADGRRLAARERAESVEREAAAAA